MACSAPKRINITSGGGGGGHGGDGGCGGGRGCGGGGGRGCGGGGGGCNGGGDGFHIVCISAGLILITLVESGRLHLRTYSFSQINYQLI